METTFDYTPSDVLRKASETVAEEGRWTCGRLCDDVAVLLNRPGAREGDNFTENESIEIAHTRRELLARGLYAEMARESAGCAMHHIAIAVHELTGASYHPWYADTSHSLVKMTHALRGEGKIESVSTLDGRYDWGPADDLYYAAINQFSRHVGVDVDEFNDASTQHEVAEAMRGAADAI